MTDAAVTTSEVPFSGRTAWARNLEAPVRDFLRTQTGSAAVLLGATVAALVWANVSASSYQSVWSTVLTIRIGGSGISQDLQHWVNDGLMTFFFLVVGLEARREFDLGELRDRRRLTSSHAQLLPSQPPRPELPDLLQGAGRGDATGGLPGRPDRAATASR